MPCGEVARDQVSLEGVGGPVLPVGSDQARRRAFDVDADVIAPRQRAGDVGADVVALDHGAVGAIRLFEVGDEDAGADVGRCCWR